MGNPGWIESYLVSLIQMEVLVIKKVTWEEKDELGLVSPPLSMLQRLAQTNTHPPTWENFQGNTNLAHFRYHNPKTNNEGAEMRDDKWDMYQSTYKVLPAVLFSVAFKYSK